MAWIRVEASVRTHEKFLKAGPAACWLWLCGLAYCQEGLTDGFIPFEALTHLGIKSPNGLKSKLVAVGLWHEIDGGWDVHGYLKHNKSAEAVRGIQQDRRTSGSQGGKQSGESRRATDAKQVASTDVKQDVKQAPNPSTALLGTPTATATSQPIFGRRRLHAAWEGPKGLYVPQQKHTDFIALRNHDGAELELLQWYTVIAETWIGSPGADMIKFWTARYDEKWPATSVVAAAKASRYGNWKPR